VAEIVSVLLFVLVLASVSYFGYRHYIRPARVMEQVGIAAEMPGSPVSIREMENASGFLVRTIRNIGEKAPISPEDASVAHRYLIAAGFRSDTALHTYYGLKLTLTVLFVLLAFLFRGQITSVPAMRIVVIIAAGLAGYFGPNITLEKLVARRQEKLRFALPDALDLMVVSVEAGLGLDQAIQSVARELEITHRELCQELALVTLEMRAGKKRADALRNLADRTAQADIRQLVAVLIQTDRFGTSMAESLRTHAEFLRMQRKQEAEERANKVGVKLVFPIFFCILPAMFLVTGGPAILQIIKQLIPLMRGLG